MRIEYLNMAFNPKTSPEKLYELAQIGDFEIRLLVAENPNTSAKTLEYLAEQGCYINWQIEKAISIHPNANKNALFSLAYSSCLEACKNVMRHPNVGIKALWVLVDTLPKDYLDKVAEDPKTPALMLHAMAWKFNGRWALKVANNPNVAKKTLQKLSLYKKRNVWEAATKALEAME